MFLPKISQLSTDSQLDVSCSRQAGKAHVKEGKLASDLHILHETLLNCSTIVSFNKVICNRVLDQIYTNVELFLPQI